MSQFIELTGAVRRLMRRSSNARRKSSANASEAFGPFADHQPAPPVSVQRRPRGRMRRCDGSDRESQSSKSPSHRLSAQRSRSAASGAGATFRCVAIDARRLAVCSGVLGRLRNRELPQLEAHWPFSSRTAAILGGPCRLAGVHGIRFSRNRTSKGSAANRCCRVRAYPIAS